jgi:hypothetical protein
MRELDSIDQTHLVQFVRLLPRLHRRAIQLQVSRDRHHAPRALVSGPPRAVGRTTLAG